MRFTAPLALALVLAGAGLSPAQDAPSQESRPASSLRLSLRQCMHLALNHNVDLEISRYQPWIEDQNVLSALGTFDHVLYSTVSAGETVSKSSNPFDTEDIDNDLFSSSVGVRRVLPFGMSYDLSFRTDRSETNAFFSSAINPTYVESLRATLTMPLLKGRGEDATYTSVVVARNARRAAIDRLEKSIIDQIVAVEEAYWDLVFRRETLDVRRQAEKVAERLLEENQKKFEKGVLARVDVTEAESGVASQREGILTAENAMHAAMDRLKRLVDPSLLRREVLIVPTDGPRPVVRPIDPRVMLEASWATALEKRPEYKELAPQIASQEQSIRKAENDALPKLDLTGTGALTGLDESFSGANREMRSFDFHDWSLALSFEWPIERRTARGALNRSQLELRRLALQKRSLEDQILLEVRGGVRDITTTEKRIEATRRARQLAQERFEAELNRRDAGLRTTFHVLDAEERLSEAKTNEIKAFIDYELAVMALERASGTLLERHGILIHDNLVPRQAR